MRDAHSSFDPSSFRRSPRAASPNRRIAARTRWATPRSRRLRFRRAGRVQTRFQLTSPARAQDPRRQLHHRWREARTPPQGRHGPRPSAARRRAALPRVRAADHDSAEPLRVSASLPAAPHAAAHRPANGATLASSVCPPRPGLKPASHRFQHSLRCLLRPPGAHGFRGQERRLRLRAGLPAARSGGVAAPRPTRQLVGKGAARLARRRHVAELPYNRKSHNRSASPYPVRSCRVGRRRYGRCRREWRW